MRDRSDTLRMVFGFCLLGIIAALIAAIGLGHVEEKTSYGLHELLLLLGLMGSQFCNWAFGGTRNKDG